MIIYSIVPSEVIFEQRQETTEKKRYISYQGETLEVTPVSENRYRVNRIISTCLKTYLDPRIQPGAILETGEVNEQ